VELAEVAVEGVVDGCLVALEEVEGSVVEFAELLLEDFEWGLGGVAVLFGVGREDFAFDVGGALEPPGADDGLLGDGLFDGVLWVEVLEHGGLEGVEFGGGFVGQNNLGGGESVFECVLRGGLFAVCGFWSG